MAIEELQITMWRVKGHKQMYKTEEEAKRVDRVYEITNVLRSKEAFMREEFDIDEAIEMLLKHFTISPKA